ncbi:hypothetical protein CcaverHIS002_0102620 [Cutaneotrichosporon cavernicola]|uniref:Uncharacterized protein n=1 Tax=Cutaneotrichosporon cavernicola TaxID=279322 RepID=A0AA48ID62_9TREE|nr:uncharacterized protein CcaverHIS019_0102560 [Cutaneotrichosporon cavernicola]BEI79733.1 hypothetical protein CcaverHIS002_0102620 [Cutaneotrichosporon cavernicola]BEI87538.1 hypothetical protein CcaverHIS019_0102560 [Cutaneotrichosporon cavernicola]BEI95310.1 hypothetical protein CcaverHIS631_0102590 [Cutaneotrichosporon cavernicola]BEJ03083.1 hypothetical protein CcaverHIS641_0102580 [Cutaneotrichosporon cavernicola]
MSNLILVMDPEQLDQIDELGLEQAAIQKIMDDHRKRYNQVARAVWALTLAGGTDFRGFHAVVLRLVSENKVIEALRRDLDQQIINVAAALPDLTDLNDGGCINCLDVDNDQGEPNGLEPTSEMSVNEAPNFNGLDTDMDQMGPNDLHVAEGDMQPFAS